MCPSDLSKLQVKNGINSATRTTTNLQIIKCNKFHDPKTECAKDFSIYSFTQNHYIEMNYLAEKVDFKKYGEKPTK